MAVGVGVVVAGRGEAVSVGGMGEGGTGEGGIVDVGDGTKAEDNVGMGCAPTELHAAKVKPKKSTRIDRVWF